MKYLPYIFCLVFFMGISSSIAQFIPVKNKDKWGFQVQGSKEISIPCIYDEVKDFHRGLAKVKYKSYWGVIDTDGRVRVRFNYEFIGPFGVRNIAKYKRKGRYGIVNADGEECVDASFDHIQGGLFEVDTLLIVSQKGKKGLIDLHGNTLLPLVYEDISYWDIAQGDTVVRVKNKGKWGMLSRDGDTLVPLQYDRIENFSPVKGTDLILAQAYRKGKSGYLDKCGQVYIPMVYDYLEWFDKEGLARVENRNKWGFIDWTGEEIIPLEYEFAQRANDSLIVVMQKGKSGCLKSNGMLIVPFKYDYIDEFTGHIARVANAVYVKGKRRIKYGYINVHGEEMVKVTLDKAFPYDPRNDEARVMMEGKWAIMNGKGEINICKDQEQFGDIYEYHEVFHDGLARVESEGKWGYINEDGIEVVPVIYEFAQKVSTNVIAVRKNGKTGCVDLDGNIVVPFKYDYISDYSGNMARVAMVYYENGKRKIKYGFVDTMGRESIPLLYEKALAFDDRREGTARVKKNGFWGYIDKQGIEYFKDARVVPSR